MKGFRQQPQASRKERLKELETELKNTQMALRIQQMMVQQLMQSNKSMGEDLGRALNLINELQYKALSIQKVANLDSALLVAEANILRLNDFENASTKEDVEKNYTIGTTVDDDSIVILTSTTDDPNDSGIFRSKIKLSECGVPDLIEAFKGREVGAKAIVTLNGVEHTVELLGIRQAPKQEPAALQVVPQNEASA